MKVFLSYRRSDSQATAGRMAQFLDGIPAVDEVFLDVDAIAVGENFEQKIQATLAKASHVFVLIGPQWAGPAGPGAAPSTSRLFEADDMVRTETRLALGSGVKLIPIVLDEARMPRPNELPDDLKPLAKINAFALRTARFDEDTDDLLDALLGNRLGRGSRWRQAPLTPAGIALRVLGGGAAGGAMLIGLGVANRETDNGCFDLTCAVQQTFGIAERSDALGLLILMVAVVLGLSAFAPFAPRVWRRKR